MKTEFQVKTLKASFGTHLSHWSTDINHLRENLNKDGNTLWRRESETPEEAAVRRMAALEKWSAGIQVNTFKGCSETMSQFADRLSPPPPTTECQVDWQTLEPIKEVPVFQMQNKLWIAGTHKELFNNLPPYELNVELTHGLIAIGHTRESALRNLQELQSKRT